MKIPEYIACFSKRFLLIVIIIIANNIFLSGCWDMVELEDRGFALGVALDKGEKEGEITVTYQIALPSKMYGEKGGEGKKVMNISTMAPNISRANKQILARMDKVLNLEHIQVLIFGEELAREGISDYIDFFVRDINMRRKTHIIVSKGKAREAFDITPPTSLSTSQYISDIIRLNEERMQRISTDVDLLKLSINIRERSDYLLTELTMGEDDITLSGAAVFKDNKLIGFLDADEVRKMKWFTSEITSATIIVKDVADMKDEVVFEAMNVDSRVVPVIQKDNVKFKLNIRIEGIVAEEKQLNYSNTHTQKFLSSLEKKVEEQIKKDCMEMLNKAQHKFETDFFNLGHLVKQYDARWWLENSNQWDDIFKTATLDFEIEVYARGIGLIE